MATDTNQKLRKNFLNYLEETLSEEERQEFEAMLLNDKAFEDDFNNYRQVVQMEKKISEENFELDERFVSKVMAQVKYAKPGIFRNNIMKTIKNIFNFFTSSVLTVVVLGSLLIAFAFTVGEGSLDSTINEIFTTLEGSIGAIVMIVSFLLGMTMIFLSKHRLAGSFVSCALVMFCMRSMVGTYFDDTGIASHPAPVSQSVTTERYNIQYNDQRLESVKDAIGKSVKEAVGGVVDGLAGRKEKSGALSGAETQKANKWSSTTRERVPQQLEKHEAKTAKVFSEINKAMDDAIASQPIARKRIIPGPDFGSYTPQNTERYYEVTENSSIRTSTEPMSTFSIDVDTGSYTNARRFLQMGQLPPSQSVRIEEFINYFDYDYPTGGSVSGERAPFASSFELAPSPYSDGKYLLKIGIQAQSMDEVDSEKPWNLVFLVDVSGSMSSPDKLGLVQRSLKVLANNMRPGDKVSLVTYAGSAGLVLPPTEINEKQKILTAIDNLRSGGSTHGSAGIHQAYQTAESAFIKNGVNRVILATDGDFNVGTTSQADLVRLIEKKRQSGITLTTLGFGTGNYNEAMMEQIANKGNGNYFYIDGFKEARKVFETDLFGTIEVVAKDVKLQIEFNPEHVAQYRLVGYENRKLKNEDFAKVLHRYQE